MKKKFVSFLRLERYAIVFSFQKFFHLHKYFDTASFPFDFQSNKKIASKRIEVDGTFGKVLGIVHE